MHTVNDCHLIPGNVGSLLDMINRPSFPFVRGDEPLLKASAWGVRLFFDRRTLENDSGYPDSRIPATRSVPPFLRARVLLGRWKRNRFRIAVNVLPTPIAGVTDRRRIPEPRVVQARERLHHLTFVSPRIGLAPRPFLTGLIVTRKLAIISMLFLEPTVLLGCDVLELAIGHGLVSLSV